MDPEVAALIQARDSSAELKLKFIVFRSRTKLPILVLEGVEDKIVYENWIRRLFPDFRFEPYPSGGKSAALKLRASVVADRGGLGDKVVFVVDRDFDEEVSGRVSPELLVLEYYSFENYLVCEEVLDRILKVEFQCHGYENVRRKVCAQFSDVYAQFLMVTKEINRRAYVATRCGIRRDRFSEKINDIAVIELDTVRGSGKSEIEVVVLDREPTLAETAKHGVEFDRLDAKTRYRGKFAFSLFMRWLEIVHKDYKSPDSSLFSEIDVSDRGRARVSEIGHGLCSMCSPIPNDLRELISPLATI